MKNLIIKYILNRFKEASTWRGIILLIGGTWARQHPDQIEAIIPIAIALTGAIGAFLPDKTKNITNSQNTDEPATVNDPSNEEVEPERGWGDK